MNVLHISGVKNWGGGENHIENLCLALKDSDPESLHIILCKHDGEFHKRLQSSNLIFKTSTLQINLDPRFIRKIIKLCKTHKIDLIHLHDPRAMALAIIADHFAKLPPFIFSKKTSFPIKKRKQTLYKYNYPKIKRHLCVSDHTQTVMAEAIADKQKLTRIYHGTKIGTKSDITPFLLREKLNIEPDQIIIGNIANHHRAKNLETFIAVADYLVNQRQIKKFRFVQIGSFTERTQALKTKTEQLNLENHVNFIGYMPNASNFLPQFHICLITSTNEGLPQVIYESFFHNVPVISTKVAGIPEAISDGENGFLAEARDYKNLGDKILFLHDKLDLIKKITESSRKKLFERFTATKMAESTLAEYKRVLDEN